MNIWSDPFNEQVVVKTFSATTVQKMAKEVAECTLHSQSYKARVKSLEEIIGKQEWRNSAPGFVRLQKDQERGFAICEKKSDEL